MLKLFAVNIDMNSWEIFLLHNEKHETMHVFAMINCLTLKGENCKRFSLFALKEKEKNLLQDFGKFSSCSMQINAWKSWNFWIKKMKNYWRDFFLHYIWGIKNLFQVSTKVTFYYIKFTHKNPILSFNFNQINSWWNLLFRSSLATWEGFLEHHRTRKGNNLSSTEIPFVIPSLTHTNM